MIVLPVLLCAACLLLLVLYLQFRWTHRHILSAAAKLPFPPTWPIIGNALFFVGDIHSISRNVIKFACEFKGIFCVWVGPLPYFMISNPSDVQIILSSSHNFIKSKMYDEMRKMFGNGLVTAPVHIWKKYRRLINPVLHPSNVEKFLPVFNDVSRQLVQGLYVPRHSIDPSDAVLSSSLDAVYRTVIARTSMVSKMKEHIKLLIQWVGKASTLRVFRIWLQFEPLFKILYRKEIEDAQQSYAFGLAYMKQEWTEAIERRGSDLEQNEGMYPKSLLDAYLDSQPDDTPDHDWMDEIATMLGAGSDTVTSAMTFALITLANRPDIQDKAYAEVHQVMGNSDRDVTLDDVKAMPYLGQVIMESMRLHGVILLVSRIAAKDTELSGFTIPAGSHVVVALHAMGWDPVSFPEPEKFRPERFSSEGNKEGDVKKRPSTFLPFGSGPRNCIGKAYAMLLMKTMLAHVLRKYHLKTNLRLEDIKYEWKVVMCSKAPLLIELEER